MDKQTAIRMFEARKKCIVEVLERRAANVQEFSDLRIYSDDELKGMLSEVKNTISVMHVLEGDF